MSTFRIVPRGEVHPSPLNPRKFFDPEGLKELAASMGDGTGIIEPLVVRTRKKGGYELIAGERRWRAAEIANIPDVPITIREMDDAKVLELMLVENKQRRDIGPMEEAESYAQLMKLAGIDAEELARRIGMSKKYVYDRIKLLQLVPLAKRLLDAGKITAGHAIILARLSAADQEKVLEPNTYNRSVWKTESDLFDDVDDGDEVFEGEGEPTGKKEKGKKKEDPYRKLTVVSVREFDAYVASTVRLDVKAPDTLELFPELAAAASDAEQAARIVQITSAYYSDEEGVLVRDKWMFADGSKGAPSCDNVVLGVVVLGPGRGRTFPVCATQGCPVHFPERPSGAGVREDAWTKKWKKQQAERQAKARREAEAWKAAEPAVRQLLVATVKKAAATKLEVLAVDSYERKRHAELKKELPATDAASALQRLALLNLYTALDGGAYNRPTVDVAAEVLGVAEKVKALFKAHAPKPKKKSAKKKPAKKASKSSTPKKKAGKKGAAKK